MTDLHDLRSRLRDDVRRGPSPEDGGSGKSYGLIFATCGLVIGFALVMFVPRFFFQSSGTATVRDVGAPRPGVETKAPENAVSPTRYAGKNADQIGLIADDVCAQRVQTAKAPRLAGEPLTDFLNADGLKRVNDQITCLLTEAPARYCSNAQRRMIVEEITIYFRGIELANKSGAVKGPDGRTVVPDSRILSAIEARLRDGQLTSANRDALSADAPRWVRDRLVKIEPHKATLCPEKPWWQVWK
jgi:hypothetical protein